MTQEILKHFIETTLESSMFGHKMTAGQKSQKQTLSMKSVYEFEWILEALLKNHINGFQIDSD